MLGLALQLCNRLCTVQEDEGITSEEEQGGDPPRLWAPGASWPGTAFTRSIGDSGTRLSLHALPEHSEENISLCLRNCLPASHL